MGMYNSRYYWRPSYGAYAADYYGDSAYNYGYMNPAAYSSLYQYGISPYNMKHYIEYREAQARAAATSSYGGGF